MQPNYYIAGDWGTSSLRLYLCSRKTGSGSTIVEIRSGPGIHHIKNNFEEIFFDICQDWIDQYGSIPVILSGMVGSTIGWKDAPYLSCPVSAREIAQGRISFQARGSHFSILAGLKTTNPLQMPDLMRGEELQLLGWQLLNPDDHQARLFALPGTHNKWSLVKAGKVETFLSAFTGELFSILKQHSILLADNDSQSFSQDEFMLGVKNASSLNPANILHALFSVRSRQVLGELTATESPCYLSGLLIAADIVGAYGVFNAHSEHALSVTIIGEEALRQRYLLALNYLNIPADYYEPSAVAVAGFSSLYESIYE